MFSETRALLTEAYKTVNKLTGINPNTPVGFRQTLADRNAFVTYVRALSEGLSEVDKKDFAKLAVTTRNTMLTENSYTQVAAYETLTMPVLRNFYPKLIAKELVNVMPIDKPEVIKGFFKPYFRKMGSDAEYTDYDYAFPSVSEDISKGPGMGITVDAVATSGASTDIIDAAGYDITVIGKVHVEKDFKIVAVIDSSAEEIALDSYITPDVDGNFHASIALSNDDVDSISGNINFETGELNWSSTAGLVTDIHYQAHISLEENNINPQARFELEKIRFEAIGRRISSSWSVELEQDIKALYDMELQSEIINVLGEQIALDIDREIITDLINTNTTQNPGSHTLTFDKTVPTGFAFGPKAWYENIIPKLNTLSAQIFNSTYMGAANTLACNPLDAAIFESLNGFEYLGESTAGGDVGYRSATVASGKWKVLVSQLVPESKIIVKYRSSDIQRAAYVYAPYVPALLIPYPLGNNPSLTVMSRYAKKVIRNKAIGVLEIDES